MIKCGFFECDITPYIGADRPASFPRLLVQTISDPLKVRTWVFTDGEIKVALVGLDNIGCGSKFRRLVMESLPDFTVIINATHTHYGGNLRDKYEGIENAPELIRTAVLKDSVAYDEVYYNYALRQVVTSVLMAEQNLFEAEFSFGRTYVKDLIFNRRVRMKDDSVKTHPGKGNPEAADYAGPVDDEAGVVGIYDKASGTLKGCLLNYSCHACIHLVGATADFPGVAIDTIRKVYGNIGVTYVNGASGDVTQIDNLSLKRDTGPDIAVKLGTVLGAHAVAVLASAPKGEVHTLKVLSEKITLRRNPPADPEDVAEAYKILEEATEETKRTSRVYMAKSMVVADYFRAKDDPVDIVSVLQLGPLVIGSSSGEMFAQYALDFKADSAFAYTWFSQLSCNLLGYVPSPDCFSKAGGSYETSQSRYVPETGPEVLSLMKRLRDTLTPEEPPQDDFVKPSNASWEFNFGKKIK